MTKNPPAAKIQTKSEMITLAGQNLLGGRLDYFDYVIDYLKVRDYWDVYLKKNYTDRMELELNQTYHNQFHTQLVVMNAFEGALKSGYHLDDKEIRVLVVAAMFHDADHSQGRPNLQKYDAHSDRHNIDNAVGAFAGAHMTLITGKSKQRFTDDQESQVRQLIHWTLYPRKPYAELTLMGQILQDADMMTTYCADTKLLKTLMRGLCNEMNERIPTTDSEFYVGQQKFAMTLKWNTRWARLKAIQHNFLGISRSLSI